MLFHEVSERRRFNQPEGRGCSYQIFYIPEHKHYFSLLWDEDIDTRIFGVISVLLNNGITGFDIIGERKGHLTITWDNPHLAEIMKSRVRNACDSAVSRPNDLFVLRHNSSDDGEVVVYGDTWIINAYYTGERVVKSMLAHPSLSQSAFVEMGKACMDRY